MERKLIKAITLLLGLMDTATGMLLVLSPQATLRLMAIDVVYTDWVFIRFVGAFVLAVGSTYLLGLLSVIRGNNWQELRQVWKMTAWIRAIICLFTTGSIAAGWLDPSWAGVPLTDGMVAAAQIYWLSRRPFPNP